MRQGSNGRRRARVIMCAAIVPVFAVGPAAFSVARPHTVQTALAGASAAAAPAAPGGQQSDNPECLGSACGAPHQQ